MKIYDSKQPSIIGTCKRYILGASLALGLLSALDPARAQSKDKYRPEFEKIAYRSTIPASIRRAAKRARATRFFGSFEQGGRTFATHFYDKSPVRSSGENFQRDSCLDIFQLTPNRTWRRIHSIPVSRQIDDKWDRLTIEAQHLWFDPARKTIPMIYFKIMEHGNRGEYPTGNRTDVYGVLLPQPKPEAFFVFNGYNPYSPTIVTLSEISYPDVNGWLTILTYDSTPAENHYTAYAWTGQSWKTVGSKLSLNDFEKSYRWNGTDFVPLAKETETP